MRASLLVLVMCACGTAEPVVPAPLPSPPSTLAPPEAEPLPSPPRGDAIAVARGTGFACALRQSGRVLCWGENALGQLGLGHTREVEGAHHVADLEDAVALAAGQEAACAVRRGGTVVCWGDGGNGELGEGRPSHGGGRLRPIDGVSGVDRIFGWLTRFCATGHGGTEGGTWCWGQADRQVDGLPENDFITRPHRIRVENVERMALGWTNYAFLTDGRALAWAFDTRPTPVPGLALAHSTDGELRVFASGEVTFNSRDGAVHTTPTALAGVRALAASATHFVGLRDDGTLATHDRHGGTVVYGGASDIAAIASGDGALVALTRDGRVLEFRSEDSTGLHWAAHEITLPTGEEPAPTRFDAPLPRHCALEQVEDRVRTEATLVAVWRSLEPEDDTDVDTEEAARAALCASSSRNAPGCSAGGPMWAEGRYDESFLVVPRLEGVWVVREMGFDDYGTEERRTVESADLRTEGPLEAVMETSYHELSCDGEDEDELCAMAEMERTEVVVREHGGRLFVLVIRLDVEHAMRSGGVRQIDVALSIEGDAMRVDACRGTTLIPLGPNAAPARTSPVDAESAAARCNVGWERFGAGDLAGARTEIEAAVAALETAEGDRGRRGLGACLYNLGRVEEAEGHVDAARSAYRRSLVARPNATVEARLATLD